MIPSDMMSTKCDALKQYSSLKSIQILEVLSSTTSYLSIQDFTELTMLSASTVHRILQELTSAGYVRKNEEHKYKIGLNAMALSLRINATDYIIEAASEQMDSLNDLSGETVHLIIMDKYEGRYIAKREAKNQIGLRSRVGWNLPLYCSSGGKALLAYQTVGWLESFYAEIPLQKLTENTFCTKSALNEELEKIRLQGFSVDNREHHPNVVCIAAPIFDSENKVVCTIGLSAPDYRFPLEKALSYADQVKEHAKKISEILKRK